MWAKMLGHFLYLKFIILERGGSSLIQMMVDADGVSILGITIVMNVYLLK